MNARKSTKNLQLQIRVSSEEKNLITESAKNAGLDVSAWVLQQSLNSFKNQFQNLVTKLSRSADLKYELSELNTFISGLSEEQSALAFEDEPKAALQSYESNYLAAMIEYAAHKKNFVAPEWTKEIKPLEEVRFETQLESLKLYLLTNSPIPFRQRNIFIDTSIGGQV